MNENKMVIFKNKPTITVFTPAYNRAYTLHLCYESLKRQSCKDFKWLIVDDGSTDNTKELVDSWMKKDNGFEIVYVYKENGGMHTAHNTAYENIDTELNVCIDSDDYMTDDAIEKIVTFWNQYGSEKYAGILALDIYKNGKVVGKELPNQKSIKQWDYYSSGGNGDKKFIYRTDVINKYPAYPVFEGEKYVSLGYKYLLIDQDYDLLIMNEPVCVVEYMEDGSSRNMYKQYLNNPKGFAFLRKVHMKYDKTLKRKFITCIHYVSSSIISKNKRFIKESPSKFMTIIAIPFGIALYVLIIFKCRSDSKMRLN